MFELNQPLERETIRINSVNRSVEILDQRALPHWRRGPFSAERGAGL